MINYPTKMITAAEAQMVTNYEDSKYYQLVDEINTRILLAAADKETKVILNESFYFGDFKDRLVENLKENGFKITRLNEFVKFIKIDWS